MGRSYPYVRPTYWSSGATAYPVTCMAPKLMKLRSRVQVSLTVSAWLPEAKPRTTGGEHQPF